MCPYLFLKIPENQFSVWYWNKGRLSVSAIELRAQRQILWYINNYSLIRKKERLKWNKNKSKNKNTSLTNCNSCSTSSFPKISQNNIWENWLNTKIEFKLLSHICTKMNKNGFWYHLWTHFYMEENLVRTYYDINFKSISGAGAIAQQ